MNSSVHSVYGHVVGVVASIPAKEVTNRDMPYYLDAVAAAKLTGVQSRRYVMGRQTTEELCHAAAVALFAGLNWDPATVELLVYVTQTPSRSVPASGYDLHHHLGLPQSCPVVEVNWSCAGYVYGLWLAMRLNRPGGRALVLVGDTTSRIVDPSDRATGPLFGDAGSATALLGDCAGPHTNFVLGTDGSGGPKLSQQLGDVLRMDGAAVFNFTLDHVPKLVEQVLDHSRLRPDVFLFHQANRFMLEHLSKKMKLEERFGVSCAPSNLERFGNCSSASVPLLLADKQTELGPDKLWKSAAIFGYGAGWSWGGAVLDLSGLSHIQVVEL